MILNKNYFLTIKIILAVSWFSVLTGCVTPIEAYYPRVTLNTARKKSPNCVEVTKLLPSRANVLLGEIVLAGKPLHTYQDLINAARQKGAELGADFIWIFKTRTVTSSAYAPDPFTMRARKIATLQAMAGIYLPARTGLLLKRDKDSNVATVTGFRLNSKAQEAGVQVGDQLLGEDGFDLDDKTAYRHLLTLRPGQKVKLSFLRKGVRKDIDVELVPNN